MPKAKGKRKQNKTKHTVKPCESMTSSENRREGISHIYNCDYGKSDSVIFELQEAGEELRFLEFAKL